MKKIFLFSLLVLALLNPFGSNAQQDKKTINMSDIWSSGIFYPKMVRGLNPLKDGQTYAVIEDSLLNVYRYNSGEKVKSLLNSKTLIPQGDDKPIRLSSYVLSSDETKVLIPTQTESIYRHSSRSNYYVYDLKTNRLSALSANGKQQLADFSPDGKYVAFVRDNNIFLTDLENNTEQQLTTDGIPNKIINGTADWVYEEEFSFTKGFFWSPDSKKIAYLKFDESDVKLFQLEYFNGLYPEWYKYKYPKAGEDNAIVSVHVYDLAAQSNTQIDTGAETDIYLPRLKWTKNPDLLAIQRLNRLQNKLEILLANTNTGTVAMLYEETNTYYVEIDNNLTFLPDQKHFLITSEKDGYNHLYLYSMEGEQLDQLTKGSWDITKYYGFQVQSNRVFYQSAESSPLDRQIYAVTLKGKITQLTEAEGTNDASFSSDFSYFINTHSDANNPPSFSVFNQKGKQLRILEDNAALNEVLADYDLSPKTFFSFSDSTVVLPDGEQVALNGWQILPHNFDPNKAYPVLVYVYGGPGSQTVNNSWAWNDYFWHQLLAQKGFVVVSVDNRGTGARGEVFKKMTYKELGKFETEDMIATAKYLRSLPYVDKDNIGIYGWSYGGYMSSLAITKGAAYFSAAVAVAPVTNWRYYDNIYTERFMQKPQDNPDGYDDNSPINHVEKLKGDYLLIHGSADDNVHYQNTMDLITALVKADKQFELMIYPDKNHGIYGGNTRKHVFDKITHFLEKSLK
ncbi:MAG: S9 family peptidase [Bacteroidetes bacterium]|nr:S9 family peptidase [Bacteroidota bacterium]MBU1580103.1 S9 family peptidase [Bacteroidota bacterium]MBU2466820.1 S9 family peptidase [Bacteroidota bacterium]MBU2557268.1 S9 family peptidase [Bacteroidota bacterium]